MCGEHLIIALSCRLCKGSSPHVRGAPVYRVVKFGKRGIIPACAGSTHLYLRAMSAHRDHPRMCGEHGQGEVIVVPVRGSSPHVRGAHPVSVCDQSCPGIIPACAGSTRGSSGSASCFWDHPRMCGEHHASGYESVRQLGSSPHVRGAHRELTDGLEVAGIIPACAGSTDGLKPAGSNCRDHPRMCGEHRCSSS